MALWWSCTRAVSVSVHRGESSRRSATVACEHRRGQSRGATSALRWLLLASASGSLMNPGRTRLNRSGVRCRFGSCFELSLECFVTSRPKWQSARCSSAKVSRASRSVHRCPPLRSRRDLRYRAYSTLDGLETTSVWDGIRPTRGSAPSSPTGSATSASGGRNGGRSRARRSPPRCRRAPDPTCGGPGVGDCPGRADRLELDFVVEVLATCKARRKRPRARKERW